MTSTSPKTRSNPKARAAAARLLLASGDFTPEEVAFLLGTSLSQVYRYQNGEVLPKPAQVSTLADLDLMLATQELDAYGRVQATQARRLAARLDQVSTSKIAQDALAMPQISKEFSRVVEGLMDVSQDDKEWLAGLLTQMDDPSEPGT